MFLRNYIFPLLAIFFIFANNLLADLTTKQIEEIEDSVVRVVVLNKDGKYVTGSAFLINNDGNFITNYHVVEKASKIRILLGAEDDVNAELVYSSPQLDLALIKIDYLGLPKPLEIRATDVKKGEKVYASGFPGTTDIEFNESWKLTSTSTLTDGIISNIDKATWATGISERVRIQHTASLDTGNSGGPLLDSCGNAIGVNTFITKKESFNLALSSIELKKFLDQKGTKYIKAEGNCSKESQIILSDKSNINTTDIFIWISAIIFMILCLIGIYFLRPRDSISIDEVGKEEEIAHNIINQGRVYYLSGFRKDGMPVRIKLKEEELNRKYGLHIGRSGNFSDRTIPSKEISRVHIRIYKENNTFCIEDLGSSNGVLINNIKVEPFMKTSIRINDKITLGDIELILSN